MVSPAGSLADSFLCLLRHEKTSVAFLSFLGLRRLLYLRQLGQHAELSVEDSLGELVVLPNQMSWYAESDASPFEGISFGTACAFAFIMERRLQRDASINTCRVPFLIHGARSWTFPEFWKPFACRWYGVSGLDDERIWLLGSMQFLPENLGARVWPASQRLLNFLQSHADFGKGCDVLELGAGVGLLGLSLAWRARNVCLTDGDPWCLELLRASAAVCAKRRRSSVIAKIEVAPLSFGACDISEYSREGQFDIILASDVLYRSQDTSSQQSGQDIVTHAFWESVSSLLRSGSRSLGGSSPCLLLGYMHRNGGGAATLLEESCRRGFHVEELDRTEVDDPAASDKHDAKVVCSVFLFTRGI